MPDKDSVRSEIDLDKPVWGVSAIGKEINKSPRATYHMLYRHQIKSARKVGGQWMATPAALRREFGGA
jgi:hypothetical protein